MFISWRTTAATSVFVSTLVCGANHAYCDAESQQQDDKIQERRLEQKRVDQKYQDQQLEDQRLENAREQKRLDDRAWERQHGR